MALAAGYATTRAGIGGFLQLTELAWVYLIDVTLLAEPTNLFATLGTALVFASAVAVLQVSPPQTVKAEATSPALREGLLPTKS